MGNPTPIPLPREIGDNELPGSGLWNQLLGFVQQLVPTDSQDIRHELHPDGTRSRLARNPMGSGAVFHHAWRVRKRGGLDVTRTAGRVLAADISDPDGMVTTLAEADHTLSDDATNYFSLLLPLAAVELVSGGAERIWQLSATPSVDLATSAPTSTFNPATRTDGDLYIPMADVVCAGGEVTGITQYLKNDFPLLWTAQTWLYGTAGDVYWHDGTKVVRITMQGGDLLIHNGTSPARLAKGTDGDILSMQSGLPAWETPGSGCTPL